MTATAGVLYSHCPVQDDLLDVNTFIRENPIRYDLYAVNIHQLFLALDGQFYRQAQGYDIDSNLLKVLLYLLSDKILKLFWQGRQSWGNFSSICKHYTEVQHLLNYSGLIEPENEHQDF